MRRMIKNFNIALLMVIFTTTIMMMSSSKQVEGTSLTDLLAAGRCEQFEAAPEPCIGVLVGSWSSVWTAPAYGLTQEYFNALMLQAVDPAATSLDYFVSTLDAIPTMHYHCAVAYSTLVCPTFFQPCVSATSPPLPLPVCRSLCQEVNSVCRSSNVQIDCNQINPLTGTARWPETGCTAAPILPNSTSSKISPQLSSIESTLSTSSTSSSLSGIESSSSSSSSSLSGIESSSPSSSSFLSFEISSTSFTSTLDISSNSNEHFTVHQHDQMDGTVQHVHSEKSLEAAKESLPITFPCPKPLIFVAPDQDPFTGLSCSSVCSTTQLFFGTTKGKFDALFVAVSVFGWISLVCSTLVLIIFGIYPQLREYPTRLIWFTAVGTFFVSLGFAGSSTQRPGQFMCKEGDFEFQNQLWCRFAGFCLFFGGMLTAAWWLIQALVLFYNVALQQYKYRLDKKYEWVAHIFGWGYPIVAALILMFVPDNEQGGAPGFFPWCFANTNQTGLWWGLFYGPFIFDLLVVVICIGSTLFRVGVMGADSTMSKKHLVPFFFSIGLFGLWYAVAIVSILVMKGYTTHVHDDLAAQVQAWYRCVFTTPGMWQQCPFPSINYGIAWFIGFMISMTGTVLFLIFVVFRERTRSIIANSFSNLASGRSFFSQSSSSHWDDSSARNSAINQNRSSGRQTASSSS